MQGTKPARLAVSMQCRQPVRPSHCFQVLNFLKENTHTYNTAVLQTHQWERNEELDVLSDKTNSEILRLPHVHDGVLFWEEKGCTRDRWPTGPNRNSAIRGLLP